jgi:hypothetical protein
VATLGNYGELEADALVKFYYSADPSGAWSTRQLLASVYVGAFAVEDTVTAVTPWTLPDDSVYIWTVIEDTYPWDFNPANDTNLTLATSCHCGDVDGSGGNPDISDLVYLVEYMFQGGPEPPVYGSADMADCNGMIEISDLVYLVDFMFLGGPAPCALCDGQAFAKTANSNAKGSIDLSVQTFANGERRLLVSGDFNTEVAGLHQEYFYDRTSVAIDSVVAAQDNQDVELYYHAEKGRLSIGMIDIYGRNSIRSGESQLMTVYYRTSASSQEKLGGLQYSFTKAADWDAAMLEIGVDIAKAQVPGRFALHQNYPNPFNAQTIIKYDLPKASHVEITIYNILGQRVRHLVESEQPAGFHQVVWDGKNTQGNGVASGVYFYRIEAAGFTQSKKMVLLK